MRVWTCILLFLLVSCQHNEFVQPVRVVNNTCDSVGVAYYGKGGIKSLFEDNCYRCHATSVVNEESLNLEDTASLRNYLGRDYQQDHIYGSKLLHSIMHSKGVLVMPPEYKMDTCSIAKIKDWMKRGAPFN